MHSSDIALFKHNQMWGKYLLMKTCKESIQKKEAQDIFVAS